MSDDQHTDALFQLQSRLISLKLLPRTGWLQRGMRDPESIAEHTFGVATLALLLGDLQRGIDRGRLLSTALLHDIAEALIGDLPATARRLIGPEAKREAERRAMLEMFGDLPACASYLELWDDYNRGATPEARLVKALDRLEMLTQALAYERAGHQALEDFWADETEWSDEFPQVRALAQRLFREHRVLKRIRED
ncbi:MAG: HD domain-containing protein [Oscillochloris sp.]|nr:HD domain-containing protein [Oscillochloris sp.]